MSDDFEFMSQGEDPAADFLARESEELGELGEELGISQAPVFSVDPPPLQNGDTIANTPNYDFGSSSRSPIPTHNPFMREEPESIKKWRLEHEERLKQRDAEEAKRKDELRTHAQQELAEWYARYDEQLAKTKAFNREKEQDFVAPIDEIVPGTEWERVSKLCNFNVNLKSSGGIKHVKDVSRLRSIMLQLKKNPKTKNED